MKTIEIYYYNSKTMEYTNSQVIKLPEETIKNFNDNFSNATLEPIPENIPMHHMVVFNKKKNKWDVKAISMEDDIVQDDVEPDEVAEKIDKFIDELGI